MLNFAKNYFMGNQKDLYKFFEERYQELSDNPTDNPTDNINYTVNSSTRSCLGGPSILLAVMFLIICNWIAGLSVLIAMEVIYFISKKLNKPSKYESLNESPKTDYSHKIKSFIGFDFGDNYKMGRFGNHDYEEFFLLFEDKDFEKVREYCEYELNKIDIENTKEGKYGFEIDEDIYILPYVHSDDNSFIHNEKREGFSKLWRPDNGLRAGFWWHTLEVDYEDKTLRFTLVGF